jgi:cytochrome c-type biogenesis protein CcmH/NrfG
MEGNELLCKGKYSEALKRYNAAIKLDPRNVTLL